MEKDQDRQRPPVGPFRSIQIQLLPLVRAVAESARHRNAAARLSLQGIAIERMGGFHIEYGALLADSLRDLKFGQTLGIAAHMLDSMERGRRLVKFSVLHDRKETLRVLQHADVLCGIAVDQQEV